MKKVMMIAVVIAASFVFAPVSAFAANDFNSSKSNTTSISKMATQADCKKAGGVWGVDVDVPGKGICMNKADAPMHVIRFKAGADLSRMPRSCRRCVKHCAGKCVRSGRSCFCFERLPPM